MASDYRYSDEARAHELMIIWRCSKCGSEREDYPGINEGGPCECGGAAVELADQSDDMENLLALRLRSPVRLRPASI
jgi:hypothetical protein